MSIEFHTPEARPVSGASLSAAESKDEALARLRSLMEVGAVQAAGRLPPERTLAEQMGVSRRAVRHALDLSPGGG